MAHATLKMGHYSLRHAPKRPQGSPKTDPSALRALHGALIKTPRDESNVSLTVRFRWALQASRCAQDVPQEAQEGPKKAAGGPNIVQEAPESAPTGPHDTV
eukprot:4394931-Pyramimonas_sp.AAC.1